MHGCPQSVNIWAPASNSFGDSVRLTRKGGHSVGLATSTAHLTYCTNYYSFCMMSVLLQARELRRRLRRNPGDEEAQRLLSELLQRDAAAAAVPPPEAAGGEATAAATAAAPLPGPSERSARASRLHPDLQRLERQGAGPGVTVDAGTLTSMLSKELQETLQIEDQSVSLSLASRVLQWGWWCGECLVGHSDQSSVWSFKTVCTCCPLDAPRLFGRLTYWVSWVATLMNAGKEQSLTPPRTNEEPLTPLSAEELLGTGAEGNAGAPEGGIPLPSSTAATAAPENPAVAAANAAASAEAAANAAAAAKEAAAAALQIKEDDSESSVNSNSSSEQEAELLSGVRASRAFKVVPSQIRDLLDANTHAFRVTPKKGIESTATPNWAAS